jgi:putative transposase
MTVAKRNKRVKPGPELVKLADGLLKQLTKMVVERALETEKSAPNA